MRVAIVSVLLTTLLLPTSVLGAAGESAKTPKERKKEALSKATGTLGEMVGTVKDLKNGKVTQKIGAKDSPLFGEVSVDTGLKAASCDRTSLSVSVEAFAGIRTPKLGKTLSVKANAKLGGRASLEVLIPDDSFDAIRKHNARFPNPWDPTSIPPGTTVVLRRGVFEALGLEAAYRKLTIKTKDEREEGDVVAVARLANGDLRLAVGPYKQITSSITFGVGIGPFEASLTGTHKADQGIVRVYDFAVDDPAYEAALTAGATFRNGSSTPTETISYGNRSGSSGAKIGVGPFSKSVKGLKSSSSRRQIDHADGSSSVDFFHRTTDDTTAVVHDEFDAQGKKTSETIALRFHKADKFTREILSMTFSADGSPDHDMGPEPTIELADWKAWRNAARKRILEIDPNWKPGQINTLYPLAAHIASSDSPAEIADLIARVGRGNGLMELYRLRHDRTTNALLRPLPTRLVKEKPVKPCLDPTGSQLAKQDGGGEFLRP